MKKYSGTIMVLLIILAACTPLLAAEQDSVSRLELRGTLFTKSLKPLAIIEDKASGQTAMYEQGERLAGGLEIAYIIRGEVGLKTPQGDFKLGFPEGAMLGAKVFESQEKDKWYNIRRDGNIITVDERTAISAIKNIPDIMKNVKIKPCFTNGRQSGVLITKLNPVGVLKEAGVKEGDIIKSVNGQSLNSPHQIFSAYYNLKGNKEISVSVIRDNKPLVLTYRVR